MALSDEDKQWMLENFALKETVARFATKDDLARFATKDDLAKFATKDDLAKFEKTIIEKFATKDDLEKVETSLLTAFHQWASPSEMRARSHAAAIKALDAEMEYIQDRVKALENRKSA